MELQDHLPSRVRARVLADHERLRTRIARVRRLGHEWRRGSDAARNFATAALGLLDALETHLSMEDEVLLPVLLTIDAWGRERVRALQQEHAAQRSQIDRLRSALSGASDAEPITAIVEAFFVELEEDMAQEEQTNLAEDLLTETKVAFGG